MTKNQQLEAIKENQAKMTDTKKRIDELQSKLTEAEDVRNAAHVAERNLPAMLEKKQDIQADIAIGTGKQSDLDKVNQEISKAQSDVAYHTETVAGLQRRLDAANHEFNGLKDAALYAVRTFIENEAEGIHVLYMESANNLLALFRSLKALSNLSKGIGGNPFATGDEHKVIAIPVFQFASSGQWPENLSGAGCRWISAVEMANPTIYAQADEDAERAKLVKMGIQI